jgi:hypothetical protein
MRAFTIFLCLVLVAIPSFARPGCGIVMIFQHPPKATKNFDRVLAKAEAGDRLAQFQVALAFETGAGAQQDYTEAVKW